MTELTKEFYYLVTDGVDPLDFGAIIRIGYPMDADPSATEMKLKAIEQARKEHGRLATKERLTVWSLNHGTTYNIKTEITLV